MLSLGIPTALLLALEVLLRATGFGWPTDFIVRAERGDFFVPNEKYGKTFYCPEAPDPFLLPAKKAEGSIRIFLLGESAAMGTPDSAFGVARVLEAMIREQFPGTQVDVFNAAMMGINSFAVEQIAHECAEHGADVLVVYAGNNELIGAYGADSFTSRFPPALSGRLIRAAQMARATKTGQLIQRIAERGAGREVQDESFFMKHRIGWDDARRDAVYKNFQRNLSEICGLASGGNVKVVLSTVAVNLGDWAPFGSLHRQNFSAAESNRWESAYRRGIEAQEAGRREEAEQNFRQARFIEGDSAELFFRAGLCLMTAGSTQTAARVFHDSVRRDALPFRADDEINAMIRDVAQKGRPGVFFADAEKLLSETGADGAARHIPGRDLFFDYVHFRFHGNYELARALLPQVCAAIAARTGHAPIPSAPVPTEGEVAGLLAFTSFDELKLQASIVRLHSHPPCTLREENKVESAVENERLNALQSRFDRSARRRSLEAYERAIRRAPDDWHFHANLAELLDAADLHKEAAAHWKFVADEFPEHEVFRAMLNASEAAAANGTVK